MPTIKHEYLVTGMQRGGHHAIIDWIWLGHNEPTIKFNHCCRLTGKVTSGNPKLAGEFEHINCLIYNLENFEINLYKKSELIIKRHKIWPQLALHEVENAYTILVVRDTYNWLASKFKQAANLRITGKFIGVLNEQIRRHKLYLREMLGETNLVPSAIIVNFNKWFLDGDYRQQLAKQLNINRGSEPFKEVAPAGNGSSFNHFTFKGKAHKMDVLERYKNYLDNKKYRQAFENDPELIKLTKQCFGMDKPW
jgi:hypothetical protein